MNKNRNLIFVFVTLVSILIVSFSSIMIYEFFVLPIYRLQVLFNSAESLNSEMFDLSYYLKEYYKVNKKYPEELEDIENRYNVKFNKIRKHRYSFRNPTCRFAVFVNDAYYYVINNDFYPVIISAEKYTYPISKRSNGGEQFQSD